MLPFLRNTFLILGTLAASLLLFTLIMGTTGKMAIWHSIEPTFQTNWNMDTLNDGQTMSAQKSKDFNSAVGIGT